MSLMGLEGAIENPDEVVGQVANDGGGFAKAGDWVIEYGENFLFEFEIAQAVWRSNPTFNDETKQYDGEPELVVTAEIVNSSEDTFLIDIRNSNRKKIMTSLELEKDILGSEFLAAIIGQTVNVSAKYWNGIQSWGFVIDIAREAAKEMKPKATTAKKRNPRRA